MELEKGVQRWVVDIAEWEPSSDDFSQAMAFLPHHEYASITRFVKLEDRKRALISRLLQYALVHQVLGITFDDIVIRRTPEGKPFLVSIARGHPRTAIESYKRTLKQTEFDDKEYDLGLHLPNASFKFLTVKDLVRLCS
ncbi:UNVERIFIED_CONTAM: hypothetical protein Sradi_1996100 [Sesamum radiatum]|uniref:holo-[acyl-carrier-protein] synthase n=1 Tax=Sesamum radiatum TaxID=300843 RepID=A0AAW2TG78_SESRA